MLLSITLTTYWTEQKKNQIKDKVEDKFEKLEDKTDEIKDKIEDHFEDKPHKFQIHLLCGLLIKD